MSVRLFARLSIPSVKLCISDISNVQFLKVGTTYVYAHSVCATSYFRAGNLMTSPPNIRAYVDVKFEDKMASCRAKTGDSFLIKKKTRRMARTSRASNLRKIEKETEYAPVTENNFLDKKRIVNVKEIMRQVLQGCSDCGNKLKLTRLISETKSGLGSYFLYQL